MSSAVTGPWNNPSVSAAVLASENALVGAALALGAQRVQGWSSDETGLLTLLAPEKPTRARLIALREAIGDGADPLGDAFAALRSPQERRPLGATYTPSTIVSAMVEWAATEGEPARIVDPGAGSCRFAISAARRFPRASVVAVEVDPLAALIGRRRSKSASTTHVLFDPVTAPRWTRHNSPSGT